MYVKTEKGPSVEEELNSPGPWVGIYFEPSIIWPTENWIVEYEGHKIVLRAETPEHLPGVLMRRSDMSKEKGLSVLNKFLSALSWIEGGGTHNPRTMIATHPIPYGKAGGAAVTPLLRLYYLPQFLSDDARLALAFYREAHSFRYAPYQFLSFYKIINMHYSRGSRQKAWIKRSFHKLNGRAQARLAELMAQEGSDDAVAEYLYVSCRCAVAHAGHNPTVDPENYDDQNRLYSDLPLIDGLAAIMIEERYDIFTKQKLRHEEPYTFFGLRELFGGEKWEEVATSNVVPRRQVAFPQNVSVRVWGKDHPLFERMQSNVVSVYDGTLIVVAKSPLECVEFQFLFEVSENRFSFEPLRDVSFRDNGSANGLKEILQGFELKFDVICNGELEVWDADTETCLALAPAYIPLNMYADHEGFAAEKTKMEQEIALRETSEKLSANREPN